MNKKFKLSERNLALFIWSIAALTFVGIALRTVNLFFFFDDINYYSAGAVLPVISNIFFVLTALFISVVCLGAKEIPLSADGKERGVAIKVTSMLCAVGFVIAATDLATEAVLSPSVITALVCAAMTLSAIYFILNLSRRAMESQALLSVAVIFSFAYIIAVSYFDVFTQMNSPIKIHLHMSMLSSMLFLLAEARCQNGMMKHRSYLFSLSVAVFFTGISSVPSLTAILAGRLEYRIYDFYYIYDILTFVLFAYFTARLITTAISVSKAPANNAVAEEIKDIEIGNGEMSSENNAESDDMTNDTAE